MSSLVPPLPRSRVVLADRVFPRSLLMDAVLVFAGVALTTVLAQVTISSIGGVPLYPVPITGQTLAVLLVGATLGAARGAIALALYAVVGILGLPVFSDHSSGLGVLMGPTGGYIIGFIVSAALVGWLSERAWDRKVLKAAATFVAGTLVTFAIGLPWLAVFLGSVGAPNDLGAVLNAGLWPFLIGGAVKAAIATGLLPLAWWGAARYQDRRAKFDAEDAAGR